MHLKATSPAEEINALDREIAGIARTSLELAIRVGMLLAKQKESLPHGHWLKWVKANVKFSIRRVDRYLMIYASRDQLKMANVSNLTKAYALLSAPERMSRSEAATAAGCIWDALCALSDFAEQVFPAIAHLQAVRDSQAYRPQHGSFEEYLDELDISVSAFAEKEQPCRAVADWTQTGAVQPLFDLIWTLEGNVEPPPWTPEANVA